MGLKLTNIQVHIGNRSPQEAQLEVVKAFKDWLASRQFSEVEIEQSKSFVDLEEGESRADRRAAIGLANALTSKWVAVYDEFIGQSTGNDLEQLCQFISASLQTHVVSIIIYSSSYLQMCLYRNGEKIDGFANDYSEFEDLTQREQWIGHPELWQPLLAEAKGADPGNLRQAWDEDFLEALANLHQILPLLEMDEVTTLSDWHHAFAEVRDGLKFIRLAFRSERPPLPRAEGKPLFNSQLTHSSEIKLEVGNTDLRQLYATVANKGGAGKGVRLVLWGSAVSDKLLKLERVELACWRNGMLSTRGESTTPDIVKVEIQKRPGTDGTLLWYGEASDFMIEAGLVVQSFLLPNYTIAENMNSQSSAKISVYLKGQAIKPGRGNLHLALQALETEDAEHDWAVHSFTLKVQEPLQISNQTSLPVISAQVSNQTLELLLPTNKLSVVIILGTDPLLNGPVVASVIEEWLISAGATDERESGTFVFQAQSDRKSQQYEFVAKNLVGNSSELNTQKETPWLWLREELSKCEHLSGAVGLQNNNQWARAETANWGYGFEYRLNSRYYFEKSNYSKAPTLVFWKDLAGIDSVKARQLEQKLVVALDRLIAGTKGYQGFVAR